MENENMQGTWNTKRNTIENDTVSVDTNLLTLSYNASKHSLHYSFSKRNEKKNIKFHFTVSPFVFL